MREIYKTVVWYKPTEDDCKACTACFNGWAMYYNEWLGVFLHEPNDQIGIIVCTSANDKNTWEFKRLWRRHA